MIIHVENQLTESKSKIPSLDLESKSCLVSVRFAQVTEGPSASPEAH